MPQDTRIGPNGEVIPTPGFDQLDAGVLEMSQNHELTTGADIGGIDNIPADELGLGGDVTPTEDPLELERSFMFDGIRQGLTFKQSKIYLQQVGVSDATINKAANEAFAEIINTAKSDGMDDVSLQRELNTLGYFKTVETPNVIPTEPVPSQQRAMRRQKERTQQRLVEKEQEREAKEYNKVADIYTRYKTLYQKPFNTVYGIRAQFSDDPKVKAQALDDSLDLGLDIAEGMKRHGVEAQIDPTTGAVMTRDKMGNWTKVDLPFFDSFLRESLNEAEMLVGGFAGAAVGFSRAPPIPLVKGAAALVGGALGTMGGSAVSHMRNTLALKEQIDFDLLMEQATQAGVVELVSGFLGGVAIEGIARSKSTVVETYLKAKSYILEDRSDDAFEVMLKHLDITRDEAFKEVANIEKVIGVTRPDLNMRDKAIAWLPKFSPYGAKMLGKAAKLDATAALRISQDIRNRSKDVLKLASESTVDHIGAVIVNEMDILRGTVKRHFGEVSQAAIQAVDKTGYTFDYDKIGIEPVLERMSSGIDAFNNQRFIDQMRSIRKAGGRDLETGTKLKTKLVNETTSKEVDELGQVVKTKDVDNVEFSQGKTKRTQGQVTTTKVNKNLTTKRGSVTTKEEISPEPSLEQDIAELFKLRSHVNGLKFNSGMTKTAESSGIEAVLGRINQEINKAVKLTMSEEDSSLWLKSWGAVNKEYAKFKTIEASVINTALTKEGSSYRKIAADVMSYVKSSDGVYREFADKISATARKNLDGAVMNSAVLKFTDKDKIIDFEGLTDYLKDVDFATQATQANKRALGLITLYGRADQTLYKPMKNVVDETISQGIGTSLWERLKFQVHTRLFRHLLRVNPAGGDSAKYASLIVNLKKYLDSPTNLKNMETIAKEFGIEEHALKRIALERAAYGEFKDTNRVTLYEYGSQVGTPTNTSLGYGYGYTADKTRPGVNVKSTIQVRSELIADVNYIRERFNKPNFELKDLKRSPEIWQRLQDDSLLGVTDADANVTLFTDLK